MNKFQIPNSKSQINSKFQTPKLQTEKFGHWNFGYWCLFGIWCLVLGISLLMLLSLSGCGTLARYKEIRPVVIEGKEEKIELEKPSPTLRVGEKLTYGVYWKGIPVGLATAQVKEIVNINGREAYHLVGTARSNKYLHFIFKVDDRIESFLDKETLLSIKHIAVRNEGRYHAHMILDYDWQNLTVNFQNLADGTKGSFPLSDKANDEFSAFYYFRTLEFTSDKPTIFFVNQADKTWKIEIKITSFGKMHLPGAGSFNAFMVEPVPLLNEKPFEKGRAWIWLSNDEKRIPLMLKIRVNIPFLGTVIARLQKIE
jgi:hypothetical protein